MKRAWLLVWAVLAGCGGAGNGGGTKRVETLAQFQKRTADCAGKTDSASCFSAGDHDCRWQDAACTASYPSTCYEARCLPVVTDCAIVSSDGAQIPCSEGDGQPHSVDPAPGSGP